MKVHMMGLLGAVALAGFSLPAFADTTLTIATVNNGDMIRMQGLTADFTKANPDIKLNWVTLEENVLRQKVTTDIATKGGQFDVLTIGTYEVPIWAEKKWLVSLDKLGADYDENDLLPPIRAGLSYDGKLYAAPFYGESSFVMYRTDLMEKAGLKMPEKPTWDFVRQAGLGREHGVPDGHVQFLRRALVRRKMAAAVQHAGVEEDDGLLCRADEGRRSPRRFLERLQ
jgi:sorbitol/mannitol transport system substrate-binding protein